MGAPLRKLESSISQKARHTHGRATRECSDREMINEVKIEAAL